MATIAIDDILAQAGKSAVEKIQANLSSTGSNATSETSRSIHYSVENQGNKTILTIVAKPYFMVVETGRKPTPDKKPGREMIENIGRWLAARGKEESMKWAVAVKINKEGTELYKKGGRKDIVSNVITDDFIQTIMKEILQHFAEAVMSNVVKLHKAA